LLDAQNFGVAQRRRRVFVVGCLGSWESAAKVLFESESLRGDIKKGGIKGKEIAATITARFGNSRNNHEECVISETKSFYETGFAQYQQANVGGTIKASGGVLGGGSETFLTQPSYGIPGNWIGRKPENGGNATEPMYDIAPCLTKADQHGVEQPCFPISTQHALGRVNGRDDWPLGLGNDGDPSPTLTKSHGMGVSYGMAVRRLTPKECERLQGFPDNYTDIQTKGKPTPDGPRYKALGNSMAVPVMRWIGERIKAYEFQIER
jgi:DNA (cytosine-5)-methyltransferase 1